MLSLANRLVAAAAVALLAATAHADECVDPDDGDCHPTIQEGVDDADPGERVVVEGGVYFEVVTITTAGISLEGADGEDVVIDPDLVEGAPDGPGITIEAPDVTVQDLTVRNADTHGIVVAPGGDGARIDDVSVLAARGDCVRVMADEVVVEDSHLEACSSDGVQSGEYAWGILVSETVVHDNEIIGIAGSGVQLAGYDMVVARNLFKRINDDCVRITGMRAVVEENDVSLCGRGGVVLPPTATGNDDAVIESNTISLVKDPGEDGSGNAEVPLQGRCILISGDDAQVEDNHVQLCREDAVRILGHRAVVAENHIAHTAFERGGTNLVQISGDDALVEENHLSNSGEDGVQVAGARAQVVENTIHASRRDGVDVDGDHAEILRNNVVGLAADSGRSNADGIQVQGADARIEGNDLWNSRGSAIQVLGARPLVADNVARTGGQGPGVFVTCVDDCDGGEVSDNHVADVARDDGYRIVYDDAEPSEAPFLVEENSAEDVGDDGYHVDAVAVELVRNVAYRIGNAEQNTGGLGRAGPDLARADQGFLVFGADHLLEENAVEHAVEDGYEICGTNVLAEDNLSDDVLEDGFDVGGDDIGTFGATCADVGMFQPGTCDVGPLAGRACFADADCQLVALCDATDTTLAENTVDDSGAEGIEVSASATGTDVVDNEADDSGRNDFCDDGTATFTDDNDFDTTGDCVVD